MNQASSREATPPAEAGRLGFFLILFLQLDSTNGEERLLNKNWIFCQHVFILGQTQVPSKTKIHLKNHPLK